MQKVYDLVNCAVPLSRIDPKEKSKLVKALLLRITTITGWIIPEKEMYNILIDQFGKILSEQYANLNDQEIEYAFRQYGLSVKDWGKEINLAMLHEVIAVYLSIRNEVGKWEENHIRPAQLPPPQDRDKSMAEWMEETRKAVSDGNMEWALLPITLYDYMVEKELFLPSKEYKQDILKQAIAHRQAMIEPNTKAMSEFLRMKEARLFQDEEAAIIRGMCKKITLFDYLWNL